MNRRHCPETSKDANGLNRYYRLKVLSNVAEITSLYVMQCQNSTSREGRRFHFLLVSKTFCSHREVFLFYLFTKGGNA